MTEHRKPRYYQNIKHLNNTILKMRKVYKLCILFCSYKNIHSKLKLPNVNSKFCLEKLIL